MAALSEHTAQEITSNPVRWLSFLNTAASVYKYPFNDQLMIYAQRPDTPACATMEVWNRKMNRWVNRGAKGIALIDDTGPRRQLKYVFDIRDTHLGRFGKTPYLWRLKEEHTDAIRDHLIDAYGLDADTQYLRDALMETARQSVIGNLDMYFTDFLTAVEGSFLEELDELNQMVRFRETLINSVQYMLLYRCGLEPESTFDTEDFSFITDFNTLAAVSQIGFATSEIAKPILIDIGREIRTQERETQRRNSMNLNYNNMEETAEAEIKGGQNHETDIHPDRGLSDPEPDAGRRTAGDSGQVRDAAQDLSENTSGRDVSGAVTQRQVESASAGDRPDGEQPDGTDHQPAAPDQSGSRQGDEPDGLGSAHERSDAAGRGDRADRAGVQLTDTDTQSEPEAEGDVPPASFILPVFPTQDEQVAELEVYIPPVMLNDAVPQEALDELLRGGSNHRGGEVRIAVLYMEELDAPTRCKLLAEEFGTSGIGIRLDDRDYAIQYDPNGIQIAPGDSLFHAAPEDRAMISWEEADQRISQLLSSGQYLPQVILDNAIEHERTQLAQQLVYLYNDFRFTDHDFPYFDRELLSGTYPTMDARWAELLSDPAALAEHTAILRQFTRDYAEDPTILRFHHHSPEKILDRMERYSTAHQNFRAENGFQLTERTKFITLDEIDRYFFHRSLDHKLGTYSFFLQNPDKKDRANYLKEQFGIGGAFPALMSNDFTDSNHDHKGLKLTMKAPNSPVHSVLLNWNKVQARVDQMLREQRFLTQAEKDQIPNYELRQLAWSVTSFASNLPYENRDARDPLASGFPVRTFGCPAKTGSCSERPGADDTFGIPDGGRSCCHSPE